MLWNIRVNISNSENLSEYEKQQLAKERSAIDETVRKYHEQLEQIRIEDLQRKKVHQDDLRYQMMEKEKLKLQETQDKLYDERAAKLWELEYQKKINDQKEIHLTKVYFYNFS